MRSVDKNYIIYELSEIGHLVENNHVVKSSISFQIEILKEKYIFL